MTTKVDWQRILRDEPPRIAVEPEAASAPIALNPGDTVRVVGTDGCRCHAAPGRDGRAACPNRQRARQGSRTVAAAVRDQPGHPLEVRPSEPLVPARELARVRVRGSRRALLPRQCMAVVADQGNLKPSAHTTRAHERCWPTALAVATGDPTAAASTSIRRDESTGGAMVRERGAVRGDAPSRSDGTHRRRADRLGSPADEAHFPSVPQRQPRGRR